MEEEDAATRNARKLEAKRLKRQRIEDGGGQRPRKAPTLSPTDDPTSSSNNTNSKSNGTSSSSSSLSLKKNNKHKQNQKQQKQKQQHRFGRVMEHTPCPNKSRVSTLTLAVPGSIVSNAQTQELRTHLVGQIARSAAIYHVDEIVVFNDRLAQNIKPHYRHRRRDRDHEKDNERNDNSNNTSNSNNNNDGDDDKAMRPSTDPHVFMARILQYCECPQYLRRHFFPMHPDLQFGGLLPPLDAPHHVRALDRSPFRDGVVLDKRVMRGGVVDETAGSLVNCGIRNQHVEIDRVLSPGIRCTVQIDPKAYTTPGKSLKGKVVSPSAPREKDGTYWGYQVRMAPSLKAVFDQCPFPGGYDFKIGTSERGTVAVDDGSFSNTHDNAISTFGHAILVLGGVAGIEECVDADETLDISGDDSKSLFDAWVNVCQFQGSRTIRTEEAVLISLARLAPLLFSKSSGSKSSNVNATSTTTAVEFSDDEPSEESSSDESESD